MGDNCEKGSKRHRRTKKSTPQRGGTDNEGTNFTALDKVDNNAAKDMKSINTSCDIEEKNTAHDIGENGSTKTTSEKKASLSKPTVLLDNIPQVYKDMESCKVLYALVVSISKAPKSKVLENEEVKKNFKEAHQIFEGLTKPQNAPYSNPSPKRKKRQASTPLPNADESATQIRELELKIQQYEQNQQRLQKDRDYRIQLLQSENDKLKKEFESENKNHQMTKTDYSNTIALVERLEKDTQILKGKLEVAEQTLKEKNEKLESKNEDLESLGKELIIRSDIIEEIRGENETLRSNLAQISSERDKKIEEINELRNRLSRMSASKLDGDPNITDLGDPNRPLKLVERYQQLYDNLWTDAFGELTDSYTEIYDSYEKEKKAASEIITVFQGVIQFCEDVIRDQEITILSTLLRCTKDELDENKAHINISTIRAIRKSIVHDTLPRLYKAFMNRQRNHDIKDCMSGFTEECLAICWTSLVQDPPMAFELAYCHGSVVDKDVMREFTVSGDQVDFVVWPALRLTQSGPIMVKSVVQPIKKDYMKGN